MDVREKLVELLAKYFDIGDSYAYNLTRVKPAFACGTMGFDDFEEFDEETVADIADYLIANGVTVQDGKPLDAFLHSVDAYKGLKAKYLVFKADTGERVGNCFVLRPDKDPAALEAIRAYASATYNETLAEDIYNWVGKGEPVQEWISVDDKLPEVVSIHKGYRSTVKKSIRVLCVCVQKSGKTMVKEGYCEWYNDYQEPGWQIPGTIDEVTHWQYLPHPPKGE